MTELEFSLIKEIAQRDYDQLSKKVADMTYENAFKELNGFNLSAEPCTCGNELLGIEEFFDFNFGCLNGTIFRTPDNGCELYEIFDFWVDSCCSSPIARIEVGDEIEVVLAFQ